MAKNSPQTLEAMAVFRVAEKPLKRFKKKSLETTGKTYQLLLREIIDAFNEDRLRIKPTAKQTNTTGVLYNDD